ncbi:MAG: hypothetical protein Q9211_002853 [Gyalolechia sp. 1 TL-2023]
MPGLPARLEPPAEPTTKARTAQESPHARPTPRHHSPASLARIRVKNRRKHYLETHPEASRSAPHLHHNPPTDQPPKDPLSYDRLIRRFQTATEREADGKQKGYSGVLEADLWRSEAKIDALSEDGKHGHEMRYRRDTNGEIVAEDRDEVPGSKEEGQERWREQMEMRFLRGEDGDFDYGVVDQGDEFDGVEEGRERQEEWFEGEEESVGADGKGGNLEGETGTKYMRARTPWLGRLVCIRGTSEHLWVSQLSQPPREV